MDIALKQRLVGAIVLIALAVVVLPMLLGGRPEDGGVQETKRIELPPQPAELDFQTRRYPVGDARDAARPQPENADAGSPPESPALTNGDSVARPVAHVEVEPRAVEDAMPEEAATTAPDDSAPRPDASAAAVPVEPPRTQSTRSSAGIAASDRYVVQVASFGSLANASRLAEALRGHGYPVLSDTVSSDVGTLHRVRVGPYPSEAEANAAVAQIGKQISDVKPRVVDLQPDQAAQVTTPSDPLVRWVVQVGSFSSTDNADALVARLRAEGLSAYKEEIDSAGSRIFRVRVGPFLERDEAIRADGQINERLSLDGVVMSAD